LAEKKITLKVQNKKITLLPFEVIFSSIQKFIRAEDIEREQEPTTGYFSKVHLIVSEPPQINHQHKKKSHEDMIPSTRLYALGRKVGIYAK